MEAASIATFSILARLNDVRWRPLSPGKISLRQRQKYTLLFAGKSYLTHSAVLGWTVRPGTSDLYRVNAQGIRGDIAYATVPESTVLRIATVGDSFTFCSQVSNERTWQVQLQRLEPRLELLNFGVPAYGIDQAFLRYQREVASYDSHAVLIGFFTENIHRHVNRYRPFYVSSTDVPFGKPRFILESGELSLLPNPLPGRDDYEQLLADPQDVAPRLGERDYYYESRYHERPLDLLRSVRVLRLAHHKLREHLAGRATLIGNRYNERSEAFRVTVALLEAFVTRVQDDGAFPIIVIHVGRRDVERYLRDGTRAYAPLVEHLERNGHELVDMLEPLADAAGSTPLDELFISHYSPIANGVVAQRIGAYLRERHLTDPRLSSALSQGMALP